jgi:heat-inducible transcriptional repressor
LREDIASLMTAAVEAGEGALNEAEGVVVAGERNLLSGELVGNVDRLKRLFEMFERKTSLIHLLDVSQRSQGVQIYIGGESGLVPLDEMSVVTAPYEVDGRVIGTLGVIGPTRMAYERVIPVVDIAARMLGSTLNSRD